MGHMVMQMWCEPASSSMLRRRGGGGCAYYTEGVSATRGFNRAVSALGAEAIPGEARHGHPVRRACHELVAIHVLLVRGAQHRCESVGQHRKESSHARLPNWSCREATHTAGGGKKRTLKKSTEDGQFSSAVCDSCRMPRCRRAPYTLRPPAAPLITLPRCGRPPLRPAPHPIRTPPSPRPQPPSPWPPQTAQKKAAAMEVPPPRMARATPSTAIAPG